MDLGETLRFSSDLRDAAGALANASSVVLTVTLPDGTTATPTVTNPPAVTGKYFADYIPTLSGRYVGRWLFTLSGGTTTAYEETFDVGASLVTVDEAVSHLRAAGVITTAADLEQLQWLCMVATDAVERDLGRAIVRRTVSEIYYPTHVGIVLRQSPVISVTSVTESGLLLGVGDYTLDATNGILYRGSTSSYWGRFTAPVSVVYVAGYLDPPRAARMVALSIVQSMWQESQQASHPLIDESADLTSFLAAGSLNTHLMRAYDSLRAPAVA